MTTEELKHATRLCIEHDDDINVEVFIVLKNHEIRKANFLHTLQPEIITIFKPIIATKILDADYSLLNVSSADERRNAIYYYDLDLTEQLLIFHQVLLRRGKAFLRHRKTSCENRQNFCLLCRTLTTRNLPNHKNCCISSILRKESQHCS